MTDDADLQPTVAAEFLALADLLWEPPTASGSLPPCAKVGESAR